MKRTRKLPVRVGEGTQEEDARKKGAEKLRAELDALPPSSGPRRQWGSLPAFPRACHSCTVDWRDLEFYLQTQLEYGLEPDPDFQRAHVWTPDQQQAYVEYSLMGGEVGRTLLCACEHWARTPSPGYVLVDGKQRLEAVRRFLRGELRVFGDETRPEGYARQDFDGSLRLCRATFDWKVVELADRAAVLALYLTVNTKGTPHAPEEIERVQRLLQGLRNKEGR